MIIQSLVTTFPRFFNLKDDNKVPRQKVKNVRPRIVAMSMMNQCAKFHKDIPNHKKVKFNLPSAVEFSETAV